MFFMVIRKTCFSRGYALCARGYEKFLIFRGGATLSRADDWLFCII